jgi:predicted component of type VI protein secretion system
VTVLGRREFCDIQIDHASLSKRHCVLVKTDGLLVIRDLATTNGTKVKGQKIRWAALLPDDKISLGSIKFRIYLGPDNVPSPSEGGKGANGAVNGRAKFAAPTAYSGVARPSKSPEPVSVPAPAPQPRPAPRAAARPASDDDIPLVLEDAGWEDAGAWRDALGPDASEIPDIIDLD